MDYIMSGAGLRAYYEDQEAGYAYWGQEAVRAAAKFAHSKSNLKNIGDLQASIEKAFIECECILIEESIEWREFTCGLFKSNDEITVLPITEIKTTQEFFDYDAKYLWNSQEITPADIPSNVKTLIEESSRTIYEKLDCKWIVRIDYLHRDWKIYFLEINLIPWMTNTSLVPQQLKTYWLSLSDILKNQIEWNF